MINVRSHSLVALLLAGTAATAFALPASAAADANTDARLRALEDELHNVNAQLTDLKRSQSDQYHEVNRQFASGIQLKMDNGRPTFSTADGDFTLAIRALLQFDAGYYAQGQVPSGVDFSSGGNFRRARLGISGTVFRSWSYEFLYDLGGSGVEGASIASAYVQFDGLAPVHFRIGAFPPPESFEDSTSASDLMFLERAQPVDLERSVAGADGRNAANVFAYGDNYFASVAYTMGLVGDAATFDEQQAIVGRVAYRLINDGDANFAIGADLTHAFKLPDTAPGPNSPTALRLRERPELNIDSNNFRLIDTGAIDADTYTSWGIEAAGNLRSLYAQGGYFSYDVARRNSPLQDPSFDGWYVQASWILTGEQKPYRPERGAWGNPKPAEPFTFDKPGIGAWEIAARYSDLDLNDRAGLAGTSTPADGVRGGDQRIWTVGLNWYPNAAIRFLLDYQHTDVSRLDKVGLHSLDGNLDTFALRTQFAL